VSKNKKKVAIWIKAIMLADENTVSEMIDNDQNIDATLDDGRTGLMCAAGCCHHAIVALLLQKKANIHAKSNAGRTALDYAIVPDWAGLFKPTQKSSFEKTVEVLLKGGARIDANLFETLLMSHETGTVSDIFQLLNQKTPDSGTVDRITKNVKKMEHEWQVSSEEIKNNIQYFLNWCRQSY
jgi:hypothetical protein